MKPGPCLVTKFGVPCRLDPEQGTLVASEVAAAITLFPDSDTAEHYILRTVQRWSESDRWARATVYHVRPLEAVEAFTVTSTTLER